MKKLKYFILGGTLVFAGSILAVNITVPSSVSKGYGLVSTTTGAYTATTTDPWHVGSIYATSTSGLSATSTFMGNMRIGFGMPYSYLMVASTSPSYGYLINSLIDAGGYLDDFLSINAYNNSPTKCATSDLTVNNDIATVTFNFGDLGHTSSGFTGVGCTNNPFTAYRPNSSYIYDPNGDMYFTIASTTRANFQWLGGGYAASNVLMTLNTNGKLGLGTTTSSASNVVTSPGRLTISSTTQPQLSLTGGNADNIWNIRSIGSNLYLATSSGLVQATTTGSASSPFWISGTGFGTTTLAGLNISAQATSTSNVGFNITTGCFAISGTCIAGSGGGSGTVTSVGTGYGLHQGPITTSGTLSASTYANFVVSTSTNSGDFTAIQTAIDSLPAGGGKIHVTCGTFTIVATTTIKVANTVIEGEGACTQINFAAPAVFQAFIINGTGLSNISIRDLYIHQTNATAAGIGVDASNTPIFLLQRVKIDGTATSTSYKDTVNQSFYSKFEDLDLRDNNTCIDIGGNPVNDNMFTNIRCAPRSGGGGFGMYIDSSNVNGAQNLTITNFDSEPTGAATGITGIYINRGTDIQLINPYLEGNATGIKITSNGLRIGIHGGEIISNTTNVTDTGTDVVYDNVDIGGVAKNQYTRHTIIDQGFDQPALTLENNTNFAHNSTNLVQFRLLNSTDSSNILALLNPGTGATLISTSSTASKQFIFDANAKVGFGTSTLGTAPGRLVLATTTQAQLTLVGNATDNQWHLRSIGGSLYIASSTGLNQSTTTIPALAFSGGQILIPDGTATSPSLAFLDDTNNGIGSPANDIFAIYTNGTERFRADDGTGRSAFSTTTPTLGILTLASTTASQLIFSGNGTTGGLAQWAMRAAGGSFYISTTTAQGLATTSTPALELQGTGNAQFSIGSSTPFGTLSVTTFGNTNPFVIGSSTATYLLVDKFGNVSLGSTTPIATLSVSTPSNSPSLYQFVVGSTTKSAFLIDNANHVFIPNITVATGGTNQTVCFKTGTGELIDETTTACAVSSLKFKNLLGDLNISGLDTVMALKPVIYSYKDDVSYDYQNKQYGFIAEQVAGVDPHLAEYGIDGKPRTLDDRAILASVVKAIQELAQKNGAVRSIEEDWQTYGLILAFILIGIQQWQLRKLKRG